MAKNKEGRPSWFKAFCNQRSTVEAVSDEAAGRAIKAAFRYMDTREMPELDPVANVVFASFREHIDEAYHDYEVSSRAGQMGNSKRWGGKKSGCDTL